MNEYENAPVIKLAVLVRLRAVVLPSAPSCEPHGSEGRLPVHKCAGLSYLAVTEVREEYADLPGDREVRLLTTPLTCARTSTSSRTVCISRASKTKSAKLDVQSWKNWRTPSSPKYSVLPGHPGAVPHMKVRGDERSHRLESQD
jgi:hypothetical protein